MYSWPRILRCVMKLVYIESWRKYSKLKDQGGNFRFEYLVKYNTVEKWMSE